ncbi:hypothetical protein KY329_04720 [Candidatus Woesearchaeota archaeon]|nr:hypothetical protein [Candidatus Woesearchaeota archaeon]
MRWANRITITALAKDDVEKVRQGILALVKAPLKESKVQGFNERMISKFEITLTKSSDINKFLKSLPLTKAQKEVLLSQAESRLDERNNFFLRIDKQAWIDKKKLFLTDSGDCFHIRISLAVFPSSRENALKLVKDLLESFL